MLYSKRLTSIAELLITKSVQMKNFTLLLALLFAGVSASANTAKVSSAPYNYGEAFIFVEGGVEFAVYPNGEFDFYYNPRFLNTSVVHISSPRNNISYNAGYNYDAFVQYDDFGAVIQVENVPVYYDYYGRLAQAGDVVVRYNNNGRITRVGGLQVRYNRFGQPVRYVGVINHYNARYVYRPWHDFYMRPHANNRVVYYEPYRAYYEPVRMDFYSYNNYYQNNNYYYNKSNFYRPGQSVAAYNYGRRTTTKKELPAVRSSQNVSRTNTSTATTNNTNTAVRSNSTGRRTVAANNSSTENITRQRANMEQHQAAVRAQRSNSAVNNVPAQTRSSVNTNTSRSTTTANQAQNRTAERPAPATRSATSRAQNPVERTSTMERSSNVRSTQSESTGRSSNVRAGNATPRSSTVKPATVRSSSNDRGRSGIR